MKARFPTFISCTSYLIDFVGIWYYRIPGQANGSPNFLLLFGVLDILLTLLVIDIAEFLEKQRKIQMFYFCRCTLYLISFQREFHTYEKGVFSKSEKNL